MSQVAQFQPTHFSFGMFSSPGGGFCAESGASEHI